ncbi:hypothetical protein GGR33_005234 [Methylobacterium brachythecii]|uniref:Uncharacterized protein n=1 Tax=Methylobacterium brachythecii TaxID=1176177 RepID=A0A7W6F9M9_9HYPH|nr:hypothetical protein [Methylobacterium brachythecii]GLS47044.1 hypothetical protein GCM10007884_50450 [Methylobacterium brachythecii]
MKTAAIVALALALTTPAVAQTAPSKTTPAGTDVGTAPSSPQNGGPGSDREVPKSGLGSDTKSNNPGSSGNAERPELGRPNTGAGGGGSN